MTNPRLTRRGLMAARGPSSTASRSTTVHWHGVFLPNGMLIGAYELLETRSAQIEVQQGYVEAVRGYWVARADLELAVGGRLGGGEGSR